MSLFSIVKLIEITILAIVEIQQFHVFFEHFIEIFNHCEELNAKKEIGRV